ncbi:MAG: glutaredoxin family protein [Chloroflexi bacterium]|nr:glutaredoxin family protein [Chloroflexota bacterium]
MLSRPLTKILILFILFMGATGQTASGAPADRPLQQNHQAVIYLFWGDGCPHCAKAKPFLAELTAKYPGVVVRDFEIWYNEANRQPLTEMAAKFGFEPQAVPVIFIGERYWVGYSDDIGKEIEAQVAACSTSGCVDAGTGVFADTGVATALPASAATVTPAPSPQTEAVPDDATPAAPESSNRLDIPLIGTVDLGAQSMAVSTALIAFVDGVNPCSLWVLSVLLALTLHTGSRKKVFLIGLIFITVTAAVYMLFIAGLFTVFTFISFVGWIQVVVALVALFFAGVNIKDYFWYKEGLSFTIADEHKPGIYRRMRNVLNASQSVWGLAGATIVLAAGVSLVEFSCTAGFPVLWTNLLAAQHVAPLTFALLLALYMLIYQIDELGIFLAAVVTLKSSKLEEKQGRILKLVGGTLMLALAIAMLVNPALMNNLGTSVLIFGAAFIAALLVLIVHRRILPRFGIHIGTEFAPTDKRASQPQGAAPAPRKKAQP